MGVKNENISFSIIMPSYLGPYKNAAKDRDAKIIRAINSVLNQVYPYFQLVVISDGCQKTIDITKNYEDPRIKLLSIPKQNAWSGKQRNAGLKYADSDYICYLDIDDVIGNNHLLNIANQIEDKDWVYFNDHVYAHGKFQERICKLSLGRCGTANICHKKGLVEWKASQYGTDDWNLIKDLLKHKNFKLIRDCYYYVCHIPREYDI